MKKNNFKGLCPICDREMYDEASSIDKHHFIPKCRGGKETILLHKICHRKIHSLFTEKQCEREYSDPELVKSHPEMEKFIAWVKNKEPLFYDNSISSNKKKRKR